MNYPTKAIDTIIAYLTWKLGGGMGTPPATLGELIKAAAEIGAWFADMFYGNSPMVAIQAAMPTSETDQLNAFKDMGSQMKAGTKAQALAIPSWLPQLLLELLTRWFAGQLK